MLQDAEELERARTRLAPLLDVLAAPGTLWHRTSPSALRQILGTGSIRPNEGLFPTTYPQSRTCYGRHLGAVCLFDFESHPTDEALAFSDRWAPFFSDVGPAVVAIKLDRKGLDPAFLVPPMGKGVLPPAVERIDDSPYVPMFIPRVEAWYRGPIETRLFSEYVVFKRSSDYQHVRVPVGDNALQKVEELGSEWAILEERERQELRARGEIDLASVLMADRHQS